MRSLLKMKVLAVVVFSLWMSRSFALICRECDITLSPSECNLTHCLIDCPNRSCEVGLCTTVIKFNEKGGYRIFALAMCQSNAQPAHDLFSEEQINGRCIYIDNSTFSCECGRDHCNRVIKIPTLGSTDTSLAAGTEEAPTIAQDFAVAIGVGAAVFAFCIIAFAIYLKLRCRTRSKDSEFESKLTANSRLSSDDTSVDGGWDESNKHSLSVSKYSSSVATQCSRGSRHYVSNHSDQLLPIKLEKIIGRGRFAEVWKGNLAQHEKNEQIVSVKVFQLRNYGAWRQEKDMLTEGWMRHSNIIEFYASEKRTVKGKLQYWLITDYYEHGSLGDFLRSNTLEWLQFCDMAISIASGLAYLHVESDASGRPKIPIAHRDMKSCNILVKPDLHSCVIADFGLSLKLDPELSRDELANAGQVGTSRYMAPELLERLVNLTDIEMFKRVDVYALALVYWEMANRCEAARGMASPYKPPFGDKICDHPTKQQMLLLVCRDRQLPAIPDKWKSHKGLSRFIDEILTEAWEYEPEARITARCVYERFLAIRDSDVIDDVDEDETKLLEKAESVLERLIPEVISSVV